MPRSRVGGLKATKAEAVQSSRTMKTTVNACSQRARNNTSPDCCKVVVDKTKPGRGSDFLLSSSRTITRLVRGQSPTDNFTTLLLRQM